MNWKKVIFAIMAALCILCGLPGTVSAHEVPDLTKTGFLSVTMTYNGKAVPGGTLALYRVGAISEEDGNYGFVLTEDFADSRLPLEDISSDTLAGKLSTYASNKGLAGTEVKIGSDGKASVSGLPLGLYLVVQTKVADGYEAVSPFLVSVPMNENGSYVYDVDATPKMEPLKEKPVKPTAPLDGSAAQTGQLNWPVPVLAALGLGLILLGLALRSGKKGSTDEA